MFPHLRIGYQLPMPPPARPSGCDSKQQSALVKRNAKIRKHTNFGPIIMLRESIAIVGGGYGGIGCAYSLRRSGSAFRGRVRLFDRALPLQQQQPPQPDHVDPTAGWSASSVSAGMIHPLSPSGKMLPLGEAAFAAARGSIRFALGGDNDKDDDDNDGASGCIAKVFATRTESDKFSKAVERHSQVRTP